MDQKINVAIYGVGFVNKGAELMLLSILDQLARIDFIGRISVFPASGKNNYKKIRSLGVLQVAAIYKKGVYIEVPRFIPAGVLDFFGLARKRDVDVILDASGFSYSDQWGTAPMEFTLRKILKGVSPGDCKYVLLPQAFGPFESSSSKKLMRSLADRACLVYARDSVSKKYLTETVDELHKSKILQCPDFTICLKKSVDGSQVSFKERVAIIPNCRMMDKTGMPESEYVDILADVCQMVRSKGLSPYFLIHEDFGDAEVAKKAQGFVEEPVEIIMEDDPRKIKRLLGDSFAAIGSRFHGLVAALCENTPVVAMGWSHKYAELAKTYGIEEYLVDARDRKSIEKSVSCILDSDNRQFVVANIRQRNIEVHKATQAMWCEVFDKIRPTN